ncbi:MAG: hypothetical protein QOG74_391 [Alphaproteobacteria bacterium]|nr:hypothetical protein [Alphaproteobacteria bacterium]
MELKVVGRVGEDEVDRVGRQPGELGDAVGDAGPTTDDPDTGPLK